jgi:hypothetical protein
MDNTTVVKSTTASDGCFVAFYYFRSMQTSLHFVTLKYHSCKRATKGTLGPPASQYLTIYPSFLTPNMVKYMHGRRLQIGIMLGSTTTD